MNAMLLEGEQLKPCLHRGEDFPSHRHHTGLLPIQDSESVLFLPVVSVSGVRGRQSGLIAAS